MSLLLEAAQCQGISAAIFVLSDLIDLGAVLYNGRGTRKDLVGCSSESPPPTEL